MPLPYNVRSFPSLSRPGASVLILGSMPGIASLKAGQYYAHPRNAFWPIMNRLLGTGDEPLPGYEERTRCLLDSGIALWDVLQSCSRPGSLDSSIDRKSEKPNNFERFFREHAGLELVVFNGAKAEQLFARHVRSLPDTTTGRRMPSTSPAHASLCFEEKLERWHDCLQPVLEK